MTTPPPEPANEPQDIGPADLWVAYDAAQRHYDADFTLYTARMNLFLVVESALIALATTYIGRPPAEVVPEVQIGMASFGVLLSVAWLLVAVSSFQWIKAWRTHWISLGEAWQARTSVPPSAVVFSKDRRFPSGSEQSILVRGPAKFAWRVRPTIVTNLLPILYIVAWLYLGFI